MIAQNKDYQLLFPRHAGYGGENLLSEHVGFDAVEHVDEYDENREVLDPAPFDDLPEAGCVPDDVGGVVDVDLQHELVQARPPAPHRVLVLQPDGHIAGSVVAEQSRYVERPVCVQR